MGPALENGRTGYFQQAEGSREFNQSILRQLWPEPSNYYGFDDFIYWKIDDPDIAKIVKENAVKFVSFGPKGAVIVVLKSGAYYFRSWAGIINVCSRFGVESAIEKKQRCFFLREA